MGLGGYLAARTDQEHYSSEEQREYKEVQRLRKVELEEVASIFRDYGVRGPVLEQVTSAIAADPKRWVDFMMRFELDLQRARPRWLADWQLAPHFIWHRFLVDMLPCSDSVVIESTTHRCRRLIS